LPLVQRVWSIGSKRFLLLILIGLLVSLPMSLGFRVSKVFKVWMGSQLFNKIYNILMILSSLAFEKDF